MKDKVKQIIPNRQICFLYICMGNCKYLSIFHQQQNKKSRIHKKIFVKISHLD